MEAIEIMRETDDTCEAIPPAVHSISAGDTFPDHGEVSELREQYGLDSHGIASRVLKTIKGGE